MIRIISGTYGHRENGRIEVKTPKSDPFCCDKKEEARLVNLKVAEYVDTAEKKQVDEKKATDEETKLENFNVKQLKAFAKDNGIELDKKLTKKDDIIKAIESFFDTANKVVEDETDDEQDDNDDEEPGISPALPQ